MERLGRASSGCLEFNGREVRLAETDMMKSRVLPCLHHPELEQPRRAYKTCIAFTDEKQARAFERYLKTQSGRAFAKKRL